MVGKTDPWNLDGGVGRSVLVTGQSDSRRRRQDATCAGLVGGVATLVSPAIRSHEVLVVDTDTREEARPPRSRAVPAACHGVPTAAEDLDHLPRRTAGRPLDTGSPARSPTRCSQRGILHMEFCPRPRGTSARDDNKVADLRTPRTADSGGFDLAAAWSGIFTHARGGARL
ncbi:MAG: hypothetical protein R3E45_01070 [Rhodocyclaceae bacterium]